ncbi:MAG: hypothetical protein QG630_139 [Patescibacteria group bacterium]|nr:hypothetical protein [Patescibacteria group bacterium]
MYKKSFLEKIGKWFFIALFVVIIIYFSSRIFNFISGPRIKIYSPVPGQIIKSDTYIITGNVQNAKTIKINGKEINIDQKGDFKEEIIIKAPYTLIVIDAVDKYGKTKQQTMQVGKE